MPKENGRVDLLLEFGLHQEDAATGTADLGVD